MKQPVSPIGHNVFHVHDTTCFLYMSLLVSCTYHYLFHVHVTTCFMYRKLPATLHIVTPALADGHLQ